MRNDPVQPIQIPDVDLARSLVRDALGCEPVELQRFTTGMMHYVFEAMFRDRAPVVVRIATRDTGYVMVGQRNLSPKDSTIPFLI